MVLERFREGRVANDAFAGIGQRLVDRTIARGVQRNHLLDADRRALLRVERQDLVNVVLHLVGPASDLESPPPQ